MDNATQGSSKRSSNNRRGRNNNRNRNRNNRGRGRNRSPKSSPKKKQNPILAFFSKLLGTGSKPQKKAGQNKKSSSRKKERTPKPVDEQPQVTSARLYVGNLSYDSAESDLFDHFGTVGQVKSAEIVRGRSERSKGFGFVEMNSVETAQTASEKFHRTDFMGRQIIVAGAKN